MQKKNQIKKRLSIIVPALNEEGNLADTIQEIKEGINNNLQDYEIFIFNDGSTDKTKQIANQLAKKNKKIKITHHKTSKGLGYCYQKGLNLANFEYYMYIPGDNEFPKKALNDMIKKIGKADIIIPFVTNMQVRSKIRRNISYTFTWLINNIFNMNISYYNGTVIHQTNLLRKVLITTNGFAYQAEILVKLIKSGFSYTEIGYEMVGRNTGETSAFKLKNVSSVAELFLRLYWEIQICRKYILKN